MLVDQEELLEAKILIVEDDALSVKILSKILQDASYFNLETLDDSSKALEVSKKFKPDLILLDIDMPHKDGYQVMEELHTYYKDQFVPILVLSSDQDEEAHLRALASGARDFLAKPYDRAKVVLRSQNLLEVRMLQKKIRGENQTLEQQVDERTRELRDTRLDVVRRLGLAAEYRDTETGEHIIRMSQYSAEIAKAYGLSEAQCELVLTASPLHDIGKLAIPDSILLKPGKLTPEEWEVMKTHTTIGAELLSGSDSVFLKTAETIALSHHEKWDGTGYPNGLEKERIPVVARICGLADVFDALTSIRPYKEAWSIEKAVEEIKIGRGAHFDPMLVDAFISILPIIEKIKEEHGD